MNLPGERRVMAGQRGTRVPDLVDLLTRAQRALARDLGTVFEEEATTVDQWRVLRALAAAPDGRSMGELAVTVEIPHPTLTRLVDALVDSAFLYRTQSAEDRRRVSVHISEPGRAKLDRLEALAAAHERTLVGRLSADTVEALAGLLRDLRL